MIAYNPGFLFRSRYNRLTSFNCLNRQVRQTSIDTLPDYMHGERFAFLNVTNVLISGGEDENLETLNQ